MVYNITNNRSSLSITDLIMTSDGQYSVTVAGRDGAGLLGHESDELKIGSKGINCLSINYTYYNKRFLLYSFSKHFHYVTLCSFGTMCTCSWTTYTMEGIIITCTV